MGPGDRHGHFGEVRGDARVTYTGAVSGRLAITAASLNTRNRKRDEHLRSADFFDVEKFSEISVVLTAANPYQGHQPPAAASRDRRRTRRRCGPGIGTDHCRPRAAGCEREPAGQGGCDNAPLGRARSRTVRGQAIGNETPSMFRPAPIVHSQDQLQQMGWRRLRVRRPTGSSDPPSGPRWSSDERHAAPKRYASSACSAPGAAPEPGHSPTTGPRLDLRQGSCETAVQRRQSRRSGWAGRRSSGHPWFTQLSLGFSWLAVNLSTVGLAQRVAGRPTSGGTLSRGDKGLARGITAQDQTGRGRQNTHVRACPAARRARLGALVPPLGLALVSSR